MIESLKPAIRRGAAVIVGGGMLASCGLNGEPVPERACAAYNVEGESLAPKRYPIGAAAVRFTEQPSSLQAWVDTTDTTGNIVEEEGEYSLKFSEELPDHFTGQNLEGELGSQDVVIQIATPETGLFGVTSGCIISVEKNEFGATVTAVSLPTGE